MMIIIGSINEYCGNVKSPEFGGINELMTDGWIYELRWSFMTWLIEFHHGHSSEVVPDFAMVLMTIDDLYSLMEMNWNIE